MNLLASILGCDLGNLNVEVARAEPYIDGIHFDIADGHFVPSLTFGFPILKKLKTKLPIDAHLMVENPELYIPELLRDERVRIIEFHVEIGEKKIGECMEMIQRSQKSEVRSQKVEIFLAINPETPVESLFPYLHQIDGVLIMTVRTGWGGQSFLPEPLEKAIQIKARNPNLHLLVDGGASEKTIDQIRNAGVDMVVSGSYLFNGENIADKARLLKS